jgi:hypothetical protein
MDKKNLASIKDQLQALGFPLRILEEANHYMQVSREAFHIYYSNQIKEDELMFDLRFTKRSENEYQLKEYELTCKHINIPELNIQGINTKDLDGKLNEVNGLYDKFYGDDIEKSMSREQYEQTTDFIKSANNDLYKLAGVEEGREVAKLLMFKYFPESEYAKSFHDYPEMRKVHEHKRVFPVNDNKALTVMEAYEFLKAEINPVKQGIQSDAIGGHIILDKALHPINSELLKGNQWMAYNTTSYYLDVGDIYIFKSKEEADDFAESNISDFDNYQVKEIKSVADTLKQVSQKESIINNALNIQLEELGFGNRLNTAISFYEKYPQERFQLLVRERSEKEAIEYWLHFEQNENPGNYKLTGYEAILRILPDVPNISIDGFDVIELDNAMRQIDWSIDHHTKTLIEERLQTKEGKQELALLDNIFHTIYKLHAIPEGRETAEKLMFKYWSAGPYEPNQFSFDYLKQQYQFTCTISADNKIDKTAAYEMLNATAVASLNKTNLFTQKTDVMNQKNFEYLRDQVKFTGFGEGLENDLKQKIEEGKPEFKLQHQTQYGNDSVTATLNFSQSKQSDMYFFNSYQLSLQKENNPEKMEQTFYINKAGNITLKEAYNLMEGRAVNKDLTNKEGQVYNAWIQMDFKQSDDNGNFKLKHYHQNYGYDLEAVLSKHPIKELGNDDFKASLMDSLKKGNLQSTTFQMNGTEQKQYIEANPQFKTINIYDSSMQRVDNRQSKKERQFQGENQSVKQDNKKERQASTDNDGPEMPKASKKRKKRQSIS